LRDFGNVCEEGNHGNHEVIGNFGNIDISENKGEGNIDNHISQDKHGKVSN
jgi:hypothetical protein